MNSNKTRLIGVILAAVMLPAVGAQAAVRYVAASGSGANGKSWATAYKNIQAALDDPAIGAGGEIRVKKGVYGVTKAIEVRKAVRILGGYSGTGDTRDWTLYQTFVDGMDKADHCFNVAAKATIDGFAIMGGTGSGSTTRGGGVAVYGTGVTISSCMFGYNDAGDGGAIGMYRASGTKVTNCTFRQNTARYCGGAISIEEGTGIEVTNSSFVGNVADDSGGAIHALRCGATISGCLIQSNRSAASVLGVGGGILIEESSTTVTNCAFYANRAPYGAGVFNYYCDSVIYGCLFSQCDVDTVAGGGVYNRGGSPVIRSSLFYRNSVKDVGGAVLCDASGAKVANCILWENSAEFGGGGVHVSITDGKPPAGGPQIINCTIYDNHTEWWGGGAYCADPPATFVNCIIWANTAGRGGPGIYGKAQGEAGPLTVRYCDVQGDTVYPGTANIKADPRFVYPGDGDFALSFDSPCVDVGYNAGVIGFMVDYDDLPRIVDGDKNGTRLVDVGACELQGPPDHLTRGEIMRSVVYDGPSDSSATYRFVLLLETDDALTSVEFQAPSGATWYTIPDDSHASSGNVDTYHRSQGKIHTWEYWAESDSSSALAAYGDGTYRIVAHYRDGTQGETKMDYLKGGKAITQPTQKPQVTAPAYGVSLPSPVKFTWKPCTDSEATAIYLSVVDSRNNEEVKSLALGKTVTDSGALFLPEGDLNAQIGFAKLYDANSTDSTPFRFGKAVLMGHRVKVPYTAVYRFWSLKGARHFYTIDEDEKNKLLQQPDAWKFEGTVFYACSTKYLEALLPVYRFWSGKGHFYTISEAEKEKLVSTSSKTWKFEGVAFYAYPEGSEPPGTEAIYRFWAGRTQSHFYTISESEANKLILQVPKVWNYEGVAFYAYPP